MPPGRWESGTSVRAFRRTGRARTRGSPGGGAPTSSSSGTWCARASASSSSRVGLRPPDSSRDSVLTEMPVVSESSASVSPRRWRIERSRGPTASSTGSWSIVLLLLRQGDLSNYRAPGDGRHMNENENYDVVVIGGGAAGLSGAVALARSRRSVLVVDAGDPRNAPAGHVHNFLSRDGIPPSELYAAGRAEVTGYGGRVETGRVTALARDGARFGVQISAEAGPRTVAARRLLVATGLRDVLPDVPGLAARWGIDVPHCPYCHGWEVRDQRIGILATGPAAVHQALLFQQLSRHVTLLEHTGLGPDADQQALLEALGVAIADGVVEQVETGASGLTGVVLAGRGHLALDAVVVTPRMEARAELLEPLGLTPVEVLLGEHPIGTRIEADRTGATAVPGVWMAGNLTDPQAQVIAAAAGLTAGAAINLDLVLDDARRRG